MAQVISIDLGNNRTKTPFYDFPSGYMACGHLPVKDTDVLVYEGIEYTQSAEHIVNKNDKTEDEDAFFLALFAIGKELLRNHSNDMPSQLGTPTFVELLIGLPPLHYKKMHKKYESYFTNRREPISFELNGQPITIQITGVHVYLQAYAAALTIHEQIKDAPVVTIIDVGGYTVDCMQVENSRINMDTFTSFYYGVNTLFERVNEHIRGTGAQDIRESVIKNILVKDENTVKHCPAERVALVQNYAQKLVADILAKVINKGINLTEDVTVFVGGGSILLKEYFEKTKKTTNAIFVDDLHANAKGYHIMYEAEQEAQAQEVG